MILYKQALEDIHTDVLLPSNVFRLLLGVPRLDEICKPLQGILGLPQGLFPIGHDWKASKREASRADSRTASVDPFGQEQRLNSEFPLDV